MDQTNRCAPDFPFYRLSAVWCEIVFSIWCELACPLWRGSGKFRNAVNIQKCVTRRRRATKRSICSGFLRGGVDLHMQLGVSLHFRFGADAQFQFGAQVHFVWGERAFSLLAENLPVLGKFALQTQRTPTTFRLKCRTAFRFYDGNEIMEMESHRNFISKAPRL